MYSFREQPTADDLQIVEEIIRSSGFFYEQEVPVATGLLEEYLEDPASCSYRFLYIMDGDRTVGYSCFGEIAGTTGAYDLYWIAVHDDQRGKGIGRILLDRIHDVIRTMGGRLVIAETSSLEKYQPTRHFYLTNGYREEGFVDDFYKPGDGRFTYVKHL